ncbi:MAG TPA: hypothetical protein PK778_00480 [Bacillota bacterium]|nr:hypothetical protein [Clostridiales bacterium]HPT84460.1 hypothetical protein [Bacillota bacterium]
MHNKTVVHTRYNETKSYNVTDSPYRYSLRSKKIEKIWPEGWELQS